MQKEHEKEVYNSNMVNEQKIFGQKAGDFVEEVVQINRISKKTKGGNKISFAALAVVGDKAGKVGAAHGKAADVASAIRKAVSAAKKHLIEVPMVNGTIPFDITIKKDAARVMLKPAPAGSGIIAGGAVRSVVVAAGIQNISSKVLGSNNKASNVYATVAALQTIAVMHQKSEMRKKQERSKK